MEFFFFFLEWRGPAIEMFVYLMYLYRFKLGFGIAFPICLLSLS